MARNFAPANRSGRSNVRGLAPDGSNVWGETSYTTNASEPVKSGGEGYELQRRAYDAARDQVSIFRGGAGTTQNQLMGSTFDRSEKGRALLDEQIATQKLKESRAAELATGKFTNDKMKQLSDRLAEVDRVSIYQKPESKEEAARVASGGKKKGVSEKLKLGFIKAATIKDPETLAETFDEDIYDRLMAKELAGQGSSKGKPSKNPQADDTYRGDKKPSWQPDAVKMKDKDGNPVWATKQKDGGYVKVKNQEKKSEKKSRYTAGDYSGRGGLMKPPREVNEYESVPDDQIASEMAQDVSEFGIDKMFELWHNKIGGRAREIVEQFDLERLSKFRSPQERDDYNPPNPRPSSPPKNFSGRGLLMGEADGPIQPPAKPLRPSSVRRPGQPLILGVRG